MTPEAKSERRQLKLREAIAVCESAEIAKIAGKPVASAISLFDLLCLKSDNDPRTFLSELRELVARVRDKAGTMLSATSGEDRDDDDVVDLNGELLCDVLALNSGFYRVCEPVCLPGEEGEEGQEEEEASEPPLKMQKTEPELEEGDNGSYIVF